MMRWLFKVFSVVFLWALLVYMIIFIDPELVRDVGVKGAYLPFMISLFIASWYTLSLLLKTVRIGLFLAIFVTGLVLLNALRILTFLTVVLGLLLVVLLIFRFLTSKRGSLKR